MIYLSTSDKQKFYCKLGYSTCEPISIYGGKGLEIKNYFSSSLIRPKSLANLDESKTSPSVLTPPVPPPPLPPSTNLNSNVKIYMQKLIFWFFFISCFTNLFSSVICVWQKYLDPEFNFNLMWCFIQISSLFCFDDCCRATFFINISFAWNIGLISSGGYESTLYSYLEIFCISLVEK